MQDLFEVFSGSTVDASFINSFLETHGIDTIIRNKSEESILAGWADPNGIIGTQIFVSALNYEIAEKLVREFMNSREE
jgi:hypothetical protein